MTEPLPGGLITDGQRDLVAACGCIADYQYRGLKMRGSQVVKLLLGSDDDRFDLDDASTGNVVTRPLRTPAVAPGGDLWKMSQKALAERWPASLCIALWRDCERFAAAYRPAMDVVATLLLERGELNYEEVNEVAAAAMTRRPTPEVPEWARMTVSGKMS